MPANVQKMAYNRDRGMPWHRLGFGFEPGQITSWEQMRQAAGLDWEAAISPVGHIHPNGTATEIPGWNRIYRDDNDFTLSIVRDSYHIHTHAELGQLIESLHEVGSKRGLDWDTAGCLDEGKMVFAAAKLGDDWEIPGDSSPTRSFLTVLTRHDGTAATRGGLCNVRVVCANTFRAAEMELKRQGRSFKFSHSGQLGSRIEEAKNAIQFGIKESEDARARAELLARVTMTDEQIYEWIDRVYPLPKQSENQTKKSYESKITTAKRHREALGFAASNANPNLEGIRNTLWGVFNASTEYVDHLGKDRRNTDRYVESTLLTDLNPDKKFMLAAAMDIAKSGDGKKLIAQVPA